MRYASLFLYSLDASCWVTCRPLTLVPSLILFLCLHLYVQLTCATTCHGGQLKRHISNKSTSTNQNMFDKMCHLHEILEKQIQCVFKAVACIWILSCRSLGLRRHIETLPWRHLKRFWRARASLVHTRNMFYFFIFLHAPSGAPYESQVKERGRNMATIWVEVLRSFCHWHTTGFLMSFRFIWQFLKLSFLFLIEGILSMVGFFFVESHVF